MAMKKHLQQELIDALQILAAHAVEKKRIEKVIKSLRKITIAKHDYLQVFGFILLLLWEIPQLMELKPYNEKIHQLGLFCLAIEANKKTHAGLNQRFQL
jgi:hypothetical protein